MIRITAQDISDIGQILNIAKDSGIASIKFFDNAFKLTVVYPRYTNKYTTQNDFKKIIQETIDRTIATGLFKGHRVTSTESVSFYLKDNIPGQSPMKYIEKELQAQFSRR